MEVLSVFVLAVWGVFVSMVEERFGAFELLSPRLKQLVNALLAFVVPAIMTYLSPYWRVEFGDANEVVTYAIYLVIPAFVWIVSQVGHYIDKWLAGVTKTK